MRTAPEQTKRARRLTSVLFFSRRKMNLKSLSRAQRQSSEQSTPERAMRSAGQAEDSAESRKRSEPTTEGDSVHSALRLLPPRVLAPRELAEYHVDVANAMQVQHEGAVVEDRARPPSATTEHLACVADTRATANVLLYFCSSDGEKIPVEIAGTHSLSARHAPDAVW